MNSTSLFILIVVGILLLVVFGMFNVNPGTQVVDPIETAKNVQDGAEILRPIFEFFELLS